MDPQYPAWTNGFVELSEIPRDDLADKMKSWWKKISSKEYLDNYEQNRLIFAKTAPFGPYCYLSDNGKLVPVGYHEDDVYWDEDINGWKISNDMMASLKSYVENIQFVDD